MRDNLGMFCRASEISRRWNYWQKTSRTASSGIAFSPLVGASISVGRKLKKGAVVVYESTVYPGATEEVCITLLEREAGLKWKQDFFVGYSPERINPGDREHTLTRIVKVVSGDTPATLERVARAYELVVTAGVHRVVFHASGLSSGVYFCRLTARSIVQTRKMIVAK